MEARLASRWIASLLLAAASMGCRSSPVPASRPPNVLFIAVDDLTARLACLGPSWLETPHIDRLAASGVAFSRHAVAAPTCGVSRYAMLTGRSPLSSGVTSRNDALYAGPAALGDDASRGSRSLPETFRRAGWHTVLLGKLSHTPDGRVFAYDGSGDGRPELPDAWDELVTPVGPWQRGWGAFFAYADGRHREDGGGHAPLEEFSARADEDLPDGLIAAAAVQRLQALAGGDTAWFLAVGFYKPHLPFVAPAGDRLAVDGWLIPAPSVELATSRYARQSGEIRRYATELGSIGALDPAAAVALRRAYAACVRYVDRQVGRVLEALDTSGQAEETVVILWSDHGWHLGEAGLWGKHTPLEETLRSPLVMRAPGVVPPERRGTRVDAPVESLDLYPTLVELCGVRGVPLAAPLDGQSLVPLLADRGPPPRDTSLSFWGRTVSLSDGRWRIVADRGDDGPLTDVELHACEPGERPFVDLGDDHPEVRQRLLDSLRARLAMPPGP